jgi:glycosyltransferase involved in cell wall biosynthesis
MAAGAAIIAATGKNSSLAHLIEENKCGLVVPPGDAPAMAKAILCFYESTAFLNQCRNNSRQALVSKYSREAQCNKYEEILMKEQVPERPGKIHV